VSAPVITGAVIATTIWRPSLTALRRSEEATTMRLAQRSSSGPGRRGAMRLPRPRKRGDAIGAVVLL
jgi:hypothetical protein